MQSLIAIAMLSVLQANAGERIIWPTADGFVVAHRQNTAGGSIEEQVPNGETVEQWTRMLTTITVPAALDPTDFANRMGGMWS